jgi:hypothetical protein
MALKSVARNHFSLVTFSVAQVAIDIEPGVGMFRGSEVLHGWSHTYLGATVIAGLVLVFRSLCVRILQLWNRELRYHNLSWLASPEPIPWVAAVTGAFVGTYSHVALDSLMHPDIRPLAPLSSSNGLLDLVSLPALHQSCVAAGIVGLGLWAAIQWRGRDG